MVGDRVLPRSEGPLRIVLAVLVLLASSARAEKQKIAVLEFEVTKGLGLDRTSATGQYEDLLAAGVIDPTKVSRFALQNASSVASLMLTTEAMVAETPKDEKPMGGGGGMGGMGGMGDMDM